MPELQHTQYYNKIICNELIAYILMIVLILAFAIIIILDWRDCSVQCSSYWKRNNCRTFDKTRKGQHQHC